MLFYVVVLYDGVHKKQFWHFPSDVSGLLLHGIVSITVCMYNAVSLTVAKE